MAANAAGMPKVKKVNHTETIPISPTNAVIALADYRPHPRNYNKHPAKQVERIATSLRKFGQVRSVVVWRNYFLAGHGVREAALSLGWDSLRADVLPDEYPEELALAYVAADNELGRMGDPDQEQLAAILSEARAYDAELLQAIGYDDSEFEKLLAAVGGLDGGAGGDAEPQIDKAEELRQKWQVELGQMWALGEHRIICGDCTDPATVARVMGGEKARYGMHDPPYGISVVGGSKSFGSVGGSKSFGSVVGSNIVRANKYAPIADDDKPYDPAYVLSVCHDSVLWGANYYSDKLSPRKGWLVWDKKGKEWDDNFSDCELAWTPFDIVTKIYRYLWMGIVQEGPREIRMHPTQKPVGLYENIMRDLFVDDGIVIDFYLGSGTTIIASQNLGRKCRAIELSPAYVAVALQRFVDAFQIEPRLLDG